MRGASASRLFQARTRLPGISCDDSPAGPGVAAAARYLARTALSIARGKWHKLDHVMTSDADARARREVHPSFHGGYDGHSWLVSFAVRALDRA
jgi:hypothetical protein